MNKTVVKAVLSSLIFGSTFAYAARPVREVDLLILQKGKCGIELGYCSNQVPAFVLKHNPLEV